MTIGKAKDNSELIVDSDTVKSRQIPQQLLQPVGGWCAQVLQVAASSISNFLPAAGQMVGGTFLAALVLVPL
nr:hypothetical protein [Polyangium fumosum]